MRRGVPAVFAQIHAKINEFVKTFTISGIFVCLRMPDMVMNTYNPGLHILSRFSAPAAQLTDVAGCRVLFNRLIAELQLHKVGEVYHSFDNGSFTATVCLTESHISIHTWPEYKTATFDVFLSNYQHDNTEKARQLYNNTLAWFDGTELDKTEVYR